ncbi:MAG: hypothetical protein AAGG51_08105 [Cyanobacteria bacterium P01_G01_bin.54]
MSQSQDFTEKEREEYATSMIEWVTSSIRKFFKKILPDGSSSETLEAANVIISDLEDATQRISDGRLLVAVVGGRGAGQSSLINAILGQELLPEGHF